MTTVVIPCGASDGPQRLRLRDWVRDRYETVHGLPTVLARCPTPEWSKGAAVNPVVAGLDADVMVVADADSFVDDHVLQSAITRARGFGWAVAHSTIRRLTREATEVVLAGGEPGKLEKSAYVGVAGGGIVVVRRDVFDRVPLDPRFRGWGGEDHAWGLALSTLIGSAVRRPTSPLWHLWHPPQTSKSKPSQLTRDLLARYRRARRDPKLMAELVEEVRGDS